MENTRNDIVTMVHTRPLIELSGIICREGRHVTRLGWVF